MDKELTGLEQINDYARKTKVYNRENKPDIDWKFNNDKPIYSQIEDYVIGMMLNGEFKAGDRIPSVRDFAIMASVNPNTVQRALINLENLGLLVTSRTMGKFITSNLDLIENERDKRGKAVVAEFLLDMEKLGFDFEKSMSLLAKAWGS